MNFDTKSGDVFLFEFSRQVALDESGLSKQLAGLVQSDPFDSALKALKGMGF